MAHGAFPNRPGTAPLLLTETCVEGVKRSTGWTGYCPDSRAGPRTRLHAATAASLREIGQRVTDCVVAKTELSLRRGWLSFVAGYGISSMTETTCSPRTEAWAVYGDRLPARP